MCGFPWTDELRLSLLGNVVERQPGHWPIKAISSVRSVGCMLRGHSLAPGPAQHSCRRKILDHCGQLLLYTRDRAVTRPETSCIIRCGVATRDLEHPCSKTDPRAIGKFRSWDCVCGGDSVKPCAFHALMAHCRLLDERFAA